MPHRTPRVPLVDLPGKLPTVPVLPGEDELDVLTAASLLIADFNSAIQKGDWVAFENLFLEDCWHKDHLALTYDKRTFYRQKAIRTAWKFLVPERGIKQLEIGKDWGHVQLMRPSPQLAWINLPFTFETTSPAAECAGIIKLVPDRCDGGKWKIWIIYTCFQQLVEHPFVPLPRQGAPINPAVERGMPSAHGLPPACAEPYDAIVIGGGNAGLGALSYMEICGLNAVLCEKQPCVGDTWAKRYSALKLHTFKDFSRLPFENYPEDYPTYVPGHLLAKFYIHFVQKLQLPVYADTQVHDARFDEAAKLWTVDVTSGSTGETRILHSKNIVLATGYHGAVPKDIDVPGREKFKGKVLHSTQYTDSREYAGKEGVVIGPGPSGSDIVWDMVQYGAENVTLVQRSPNGIFKTDALHAMLSPLYNPDIPLRVSDLNYYSDPLSIVHKMTNPALRAKNEELHPGLHDALEAKGYKVRRELDVIEHIYQSHGGHCFDERGFSELILEDKVKMASGTPVGFTENALVLDTGKEIEADVVVFATGFKHISVPDFLSSSKLIETRVTDRLEEVLGGVDSEGECPGMWTASGHERFYYTGFEFPISRAGAPIIAAQIRLDIEGKLPTRYARAQA